ncbi:MAG: LysR family transcriptional regulator [Parvibaculum sp.]|nr:LysR family transcriptional regulator [Parvibaculum sp.]
MDLDVRPLRCFIAVAEEQSFSRAAERLHIAQPTLSAQIRELERIIGFDLFIRTTRRVDLSPRGRAFLESARRMVEESERLKRTAERLRRAEGARLSIGAAFYTIDIAERVSLLEGFIEAHPEIAIDIDTRWQSELMEGLEKGTVDLILMIGVPVPQAALTGIIVRGEGSELLYRDNLRHLVLRREPVRLLVPAELPVAALDPVPLHELRDMRVAMLSPAHGAPVTAPISMAFEQARALPVVPPEPHGIGVERYGRQFRIPAVTLGWFTEHEIHGGEMRRRSIAGLDAETTFVLVGDAENHSAPVEAFWKFAEERFAMAG